MTDLINPLSLWNVYYGAAMMCNKDRPRASDVGDMFCFVLFFLYKPAPT